MDNLTLGMIRNFPEFDGLHLKIGELSKHPTSIGFHYRVATITAREIVIEPPKQTYITNPEMIINNRPKNYDPLEKIAKIFKNI